MKDCSSGVEAISLQRYGILPGLGFYLQRYTGLSVWSLHLGVKMLITDRVIVRSRNPDVARLCNRKKCREESSSGSSLIYLLLL